MVPLVLTFDGLITFDSPALNWPAAAGVVLLPAVPVPLLPPQAARTSAPTAVAAASPRILDLFMRLHASYGDISFFGYEVSCSARRPSGFSGRGRPAVRHRRG